MNQSRTIKEISVIFIEMCGGDVDKASKYANKISILYGLPGNIKHLMKKVETKISN